MGRGQQQCPALWPLRELPCSRGQDAWQFRKCERAYKFFRPRYVIAALMRSQAQFGSTGCHITQQAFELAGRASVAADLLPHAPRRKSRELARQSAECQPNRFARLATNLPKS